MYYHNRTYYVHSCTGEVFEFSSWDSLISYISKEFGRSWRWHFGDKEDFGITYNFSLRTLRYEPKYEFTYLVRDSKNQIVKFFQLEEYIREPRYRYWIWSCQYVGYSEYNPEKHFRKAPINNTGNRRGRGHYYRRPRHINEKKALMNDEIKEYNVKIRPNRNFRNLPNPWDDIRFSHGHSGKNWKKYRKHQYKTRN